MASLDLGTCHKLFDVWDMFFSRFLSLLNDIGNLLSLERSNGFFEVWQDGNDLGMMHCVVKCKGGFQNVVHINAVEMSRDRRIRIHPFACWHFEANCSDHVTALLDGNVDGEGV